MRIPEGWTCSEALVRWADEELDGSDAKACVPAFVDYWRSVAGAKGVKVDWDATFRNRMRELHARGQAPELPPRREPTPSPSPPRTPEQIAQAKAARALVLAIPGIGGAPT